MASAGTLGLVGHGIRPGMATQLAALGVPDVGFTSRRLTAADVRQADLVLGARPGSTERPRWSWSLRPCGGPFTLLEFARLLTDHRAGRAARRTVIDRLQAAVPLAASRAPAGRDAADAR